MLPKGSQFNWAAIFLGFTAIFISCQSAVPTTDLRTAMNTYDRLILKTDGDSIALLYALDGDLGNIAHGRDSIRRFLQKFQDFKVLEHLSTIDSIYIANDYGFIVGSYRQKVVVPNNKTRDTVSIKGSFQSKWVRTPEHGWQIKKMETQPLK